MSVLIDVQLITETIKLYFNGTYHGDAGQLKRAFHPNAYITGNINGQLVDWTLSDFISRVTNPPTAADRQEPFEKEILFIDEAHNVAMVKTRVVVGGLIFTDYINLIKVDGQWIIRNKSFTT